MDYRIEEKKGMRVVGKKEWVSMADGEQLKKIPAMWDALTEADCKRIMDLSDSKGGAILGLCADMYNDGFDYWIATVSNKECPADMTEMEITACTWAIFEAVGPMRPTPNKLQEVIQWIFSEWFPTSGYEHAQAPEVEYYYDGDMMAEDYKCEVWIPIIKKNN